MSKDGFYQTYPDTADHGHHTDRDKPGGGDFVLIDGVEFLAEVLLIILGNVVMAGFVMQKEMDEIL